MINQTPALHYWLPRWAPMDGIVLFGLVLLKRTASRGLVEHEIVHHRQQMERGILRFYWDYVFFPTRRVAYEAEGYAAQIRIDKVSVGWCAKKLSGGMYLWPCTYEYALEAIRSRV